jgi:hypothetical protein
LERTGPIQAVAPGGAGHLMWGRNLHAVDDPTVSSRSLIRNLAFAFRFVLNEPSPCADDGWRWRGRGLQSAH